MNKSKQNSLFESLCEETYENVYKYLMFVFKNKTEAEDVTQEVFLTVYNNINKIEVHPNPKGFVFVTAKNLANNHKKCLYKRLQQEIAVDEDINNLSSKKNSIENQIDGEINEFDFLPLVLNDLSPDKKQLYRLYYTDKLSMKEIALVTNTTYTALRMKYVRLRKEILERVKEISEKYFVT